VFAYQGTLTFKPTYKYNKGSSNNDTSHKVCNTFQLSTLIRHAWLDFMWFIETI